MTPRCETWYALAAHAPRAWLLWPLVGAACAVAYIGVGALALMHLEPGWTFVRSMFFVVQVAAGVGYGEFDPASLGADWFVGIYVCILGGATVLSVLVFAAHTLLDVSEDIDFRPHGAWHRLSGGERQSRYVYVTARLVRGYGGGGRPSSPARRRRSPRLTAALQQFFRALLFLPSLPLCTLRLAYLPQAVSTVS